MMNMRMASTGAAILCAGIAHAAPPTTLPTTVSTMGVAPTSEPATVPSSVPSTAAPDQLDDGVLGTRSAVSADPTEPTPVPPVAKHPKKGEFVIAPIPKFDPSQEFSLVVIGQYIFRPNPADTVSPPSVIAAGGFYSQQDSYAGILGYLGYLDEDKWRVAAATAAGQYNYNFYGVGDDVAQYDRAIGIEQPFVVGMANVTRQIFPHFYVGPRVQASRVHIDVDQRTVPFPLPESDTTFNNIALGIKLQYDTRDNTFYPTRGLFVEGQLDFFNEAFGGDFDYEAYQLEYNQYFPVQSRSVLAVRGFARFTSGDPPFFDLSTFGQRSDLRGYEAGKYRDKNMFAVQAEYRYLLTDWLGLAAFAGTGEVFDSVDSVNANDLLWSGGVGVRLRLAKQNPVFYRIDLAYGDDGTAVYLGVGQAF